MKRFEKISPVSMTEQIYSLLKQAILNMELKPNTVLVENSLAQKFGTSKTPVREAIRRLETDGLVILIPYKGTTVAPIMPQDIKEIYEVRSALEGMAAWKAAKRLSAAQIKNLECLLAQSEEALDEGRIVDCGLLGVEFHNTIVQYAEHRRLTDARDILEGHLERFHRLLQKIPGRMEKSTTEHRDIFNAVRRHDADEAYLAVIHHTESFINDFMTDFEDVLRKL
jgi:DNA-binding GntR family transcriptional regulator